MSDAIFIVKRTKVFDRHAKRIWREKDIQKIVEDLAKEPESGTPLGGGLYKLRVASHGRGKRGGSRIIYLLITDMHRIYLLTAYAKNEKDDLTQDEYRLLYQLAETFKKKGEIHG